MATIDSHLVIELNQDGNEMRVVVTGNLDQTSLSKDLLESLSATKREALLNAKAVKLSLKHVEHVDTAGLAWLVNALTSLKSHKVSVEVTDLPSKLLDLANLSNASPLLNHA